MHGAAREFYFFSSLLQEPFCRQPRGWHSPRLRVCVCVSVRHPSIIHLLLLLVPFSLSFSLALLHLSEILINNQGSTMLRCFVMGS